MLIKNLFITFNSDLFSIHELDCSIEDLKKEFLVTDKNGLFVSLQYEDQEGAIEYLPPVSYHIYDTLTEKSIRGAGHFIITTHAAAEKFSKVISVRTSSIIAYEKIFHRNHKLIGLLLKKIEATYIKYGREKPVFTSHFFAHQAYFWVQGEIAIFTGQ